MIRKEGALSMVDTLAPRLEKMQRQFQHMLNEPLKNIVSLEALGNTLPFLLSTENYPEILISERSSEFNRGAKFVNTIAAEDITIRQYLSAYARDLGDHFSLEETRKKAWEKYPNEYTNFMADKRSSTAGENLWKFINFFNTVTTLADKGQTPESIQLKDIPAILKDGLCVIHNNALFSKQSAQKYINRAQSFLEEETITDVAYDYYSQIKFQEQPVTPNWIPEDLITRIRSSSSGFPRFKAELEPLVDKHHRIQPEELKTSHSKLVTRAQISDDMGDVQLAVVHTISKTMESLGMSPNARGERGR